MPELPEVETTRKGIEPYLVAQRLARISIHFPTLRWPIPRDITTLEGQIITSVERRGKYLLVNTAKGSIIIHLGMSGFLQLLPSDQALKKHDHFAMLLETGMELRLNDSRRFGSVLFATKPLNHPLLKNLGPEPLGRAFNASYLLKKLHKLKKAIKLSIMDSQLVVGVGNIYANEALFLAKINPLRASSSLTQSECRLLVESIKKVLKKAIKAGGTTLKDFQDIDGKPGYFAQKLQIYGRSRQTCFVCHDTIQTTRLGQRITLWCPSCQK